ncbi:MAG: hypothetical protein LRY50_01420 [Geovibrio sp.]|nr:hypothetical protein [Geovibrio sp.]
MGSKICMDCHMDMDKSHDMASGHSASAHMRIIMPGQKDVIEPMSGWGADNDPLGKKQAFWHLPLTAATMTLCR